MSRVNEGNSDIISKSVIGAFVINFPEVFSNDEKRIAASLFQSNSRNMFEEINITELDQQNVAGQLIQVKYDIIDDKAKNVWIFLKHFYHKTVQGQIHSIGFGYPKIGVDILFMEILQEAEETIILNAYLLQNAVPMTVERNKENSIIKVTLKGFYAANQEINTLAAKYLQAQAAAQKAEEESKANQT